MVEKNKVSIEEFIKIANVKKETIKKNRNKIPGLTYENGEFDIVKGMRYPGDYHRYKLKNSADRRYLLLKAISEYKYIDHIPLQVYPEQFKELLKELLDAKLIKENHLYNKPALGCRAGTGRRPAVHGRRPADGRRRAVGRRTAFLVHFLQK